MIPAQLLNHLWQSTLFAAAAGLLTLALRKNRAPVRYWLWFAVSCKFLIPFSILVTLGSQVEWRKAQTLQPSALPLVMEQISQPFAPAAPAPVPAKKPPVSSATVLLCAWLSGLSIVVFSWFRQWRRIRTAMRLASPLHLNLPIRAMSSPARLEPGVFGIFRPVLLLPEGITDRLTPAQWQAILAHELCHVRRRDNLTAAIHMAVEAAFWFHPLVWWIGKRLVDEREHACDEAVLTLGSEPEIYAEGILNVCKLYVESPLVCMSGVTGSDLKIRIRAIMTRTEPLRLGLGRKLLLTAMGLASVAGPVAIGVVNAPLAKAQAQDASRLAFEVASIKENHSGRLGTDGFQVAHGALTIRNVSLKMLVQASYHVQGAQIVGGPSWLTTDRYDLLAKGKAEATNQQVYSMLQPLLAERFKLAVHNETRELPIYSLEVVKTGTKLAKRGDGDCAAISVTATAQLECGAVGTVGNLQGGFMMGRRISVRAIATALSSILDRSVVDKTGLSGTYDLNLSWAEAGAQRPVPENGEQTRPADASELPPSIFTAVQERLGLRLVSTKGPVEVLVIDHAEKPSEN
jgi:bla regulator protein BlaR1